MKRSGNAGFMKNKKRERKSGVEELDINSLLDILVILLVFLLNSYNPSDLFVDVPGRLTLPQSETEILGNATLTMKVISVDEIWVDEAKIENPWGSSEALKTSLVEAQKMWNDRLVKIWGEKLMKEKGVPVNLVVDEDVPYSTIKRIMRVASEAKFNQFKLIVQYAK